jgi:hypothetical protein
LIRLRHTGQIVGTEERLPPQIVVNMHFTASPLTSVSKCVPLAHPDALQSKGDRNMVDAHLAALSEKHANLESQIDQEVHRPMPDEILIAQWKKEKLRLKEVMTGIR